MARNKRRNYPTETTSVSASAAETIGPVTNLHETAVTKSSITLAWTAPTVTFTESPDGTIVEHSTDPPITDSLGNTWALTAGHQILINGAVDKRTGSAEVDVLYYHSHAVYQQNSRGTWYETTTTSGPWLVVTAPFVTHFGVIAELLKLKGMLFNASETAIVNQIIADVGKLMP